MKQQDFGLSLCTRRTRKAVFIDQMAHLVSWVEQLALITDHRSPITDHRSPITEHRAPSTEHRAPSAERELRTFPA